MEAREPEPVRESLRIVGEEAGGVGPLGLVCEADPPVIEAEHPVARREEVVHLEGPALQVVGQAVHQDDCLPALALQPVVDVYAVGFCLGHGTLLWLFR